jgi:hypothetical protein
MGGHRELIETYGGHHSIISGHLHFFEGETFDPRYQYITCLREPVERVLSWLYFVLYDAMPTENAKPIKAAAEAFLRSEGKECPTDLVYGYSNYYVYHYSLIADQSIYSKTKKSIYQEINLQSALSALNKYDVVGIYEDFSVFTAEVANLIGLEAPKKIRKVNVSTPRPPVETISKALRDRILELNQDDIRLYETVVEQKRQRKVVAPVPKSFFQWLHRGQKNRKMPVVQDEAEPNSRVHWVKYEPEETVLTAAFGSLSVPSPPSRLAPSEQKTVRVNITNEGFQNWRNGPCFPLRAGYRWLLPSGEIYQEQGVRTLLPATLISPGATMTIDMTVVAPPEPGSYTLVLTVYQDHFASLEQRGLTPAIIQVMVAKPDPV